MIFWRCRCVYCVVCIIDNILVDRAVSADSVRRMQRTTCSMPNMWLCVRLFAVCFMFGCVMCSAKCLSGSISVRRAHRLTSRTSCDVRIYSFTPIKSHRKRVQSHIFFRRIISHLSQVYAFNGMNIFSINFDPPRMKRKIQRRFICLFYFLTWLEMHCACIYPTVRYSSLPFIYSFSPSHISRSMMISVLVYDEQRYVPVSVNVYVAWIYAVNKYLSPPNHAHMYQFNWLSCMAAPTAAAATSYWIYVKLIQTIAIADLRWNYKNAQSSCEHTCVQFDTRTIRYSPYTFTRYVWWTVPAAATASTIHSLRIAGKRFILAWDICV